MICYFIDHTNYKNGEKSLAKLSLFHKDSNFLSPRLGISLITCHRIEYYINDESQIIDRGFLKSFKKITDQSKIYERLFHISLGLKSKIVGENSIFKQTSKCMHDYLYYNPQDKICMNILQNAKRTRDHFEFYAKNNGQLIYNHIKQNESETIIFFGAGLLNQTIIDSIEYPIDYKHIILVTKNLGKARKYFHSKNKHIEIIGIHNLNEKIDSPFDIFIATDHINPTYIKKITALYKIKQCRNLVDVSSYPIDSPTKTSPKYFSLYSKNTDQLTQKSNLEFKARLIKLQKYLKNKESNWYTN